MNRKSLSPAIFIDRDGVINKELEYVWRVENFHILPGVVDGIRRLQNAGFRTFVITNQAGIGRGFFTEQDFSNITNFMLTSLTGEGVHIDEVYFCPHHPEHGLGRYKTDCVCRKPQPGMILKACAEHAIDPSASYLIGDKATDIAAGRAAHLKGCVLVKSGHPVDQQDAASADVVVADLYEAAVWILR